MIQSKYIALACDHAGYELKTHIAHYLRQNDILYIDYGCHDTTPIDYVDTGIIASQSVATGITSMGILVCGTGIGMSIISNKVKGIRAALCHTPQFATLSRTHNDANVLVVAGRYTEYENAIEIVRTFLETNFSDELRHKNRIDKIADFEAQ
jgi:ribose 5-phosphate isomerase B